MNNYELQEKINQLKLERDAVIVAHNYQIDDVQKVADVIGDSLALSRYCAQNNKKVIVFCGVHFMAESAKILSPEKTVLLPEITAGCPMADMITAEDLKKKKKEYPQAKVVCYINTSASVKAECDVCCTSSNLIKIVKSIKEEDILFVPDQNLGSYAAAEVPEKNIISWPGYCITHHNCGESDVKRARELYPDALMLAHPECREQIIRAADFVGSTKQIIEFAGRSDAKEFIIGTEMGILYKLKKDNPDKRFHLLSDKFICPDMKKTTLQSVYEALRGMKYEINIDEGIRLKAKTALDRMLEIG
ncbi:MAG: quinolinate synthase NadA [Clostridium sp.]|nr:quinolinate synthase NadA [Clostridium sp.]